MQGGDANPKPGLEPLGCGIYPCWLASFHLVTAVNFGNSMSKIIALFLVLCWSPEACSGFQCSMLVFSSDSCRPCCVLIPVLCAPELGW